MTRPLRALWPVCASLVVAAVTPSALRAQERYRPLLRDLDSEGLLEPLAARSVATFWNSVGVLVPEKDQPKLIAPATESMKRMLARPESVAVLNDILDLHTDGGAVPQVEAAVRAIEDPGPSARTFERLSLIPQAVVTADVKNVNAMLADTVEAADPAALARIAELSGKIPEPTWAQIDTIATETVKLGPFTLAARFLTTGAGPAAGLEEPRNLIGPARCTIAADNRSTLDEAAGYTEPFLKTYKQPELIVAAVQWAADQLNDPETQEFLSKSLLYERLPQLQRAIREAMRRGLLKETLLDYADFLSGRDERVRVDPDTWKKAKGGEGTKTGDRGLTGLDLLKLSALTLYTVNHLDAVPSEPRPNGLKMTLSDELLDYLDFQMRVTGRKSTLSPLFDVVRDFLNPPESRRVLVAVARDFATYVMAHDPEPLLRAAARTLDCDPEAKAARTAGLLLDDKQGNGDLRILTPLLKPLAHAPAQPFAPLVTLAPDFSRAAISLNPAADALLRHEQVSSSGSKLLLALARGKDPVIPGLDPLALGALREAPVFRRQLAWQTEPRIMNLKKFIQAALAAGPGGDSDFVRMTPVLARWAELKSPFSGHSLSADAGLVSLEAVKSGLVQTLLDSGVAIRKKRGDEGLKNLLSVIRDSIDPKRSTTRKNSAEAKP